MVRLRLQAVDTEEGEQDPQLGRAVELPTSVGAKPFLSPFPCDLDLKSGEIEVTVSGRIDVGDFERAEDLPLGGIDVPGDEDCAVSPFCEPEEFDVLWVEP